MIDLVFAKAKMKMLGKKCWAYYSTKRDSKVSKGKFYEAIREMVQNEKASSCLSENDLSITLIEW